MVEETIEERITEVIDEYIQPGVAMHGGEVSLHKWDEDNSTAYIFMSGACSGCAMSSATLRMGVERMLQHYIPEIAMVEGVDDPDSQVQPYYATSK
jgi:Fe-S cluster biogenesis protein NfuA